jgi:hypothetical protein
VRGAALGLAIAVLGLLPGSALASHMQPAASVHLTDLGVQKDGSHRVKLDWQVGCGANAPDATLDESFYGVLVPRRAGGKPAIAVQEEFTEPSGSAIVIVQPGRRVFGRVLLECRDAGELATVTVESPEQIYVPPRLAGFSVPHGTWCGRLTDRQRDTGIGASDFQTVNWRLQFGRTTMLKSPSTAGLLKEVRLRASGRGMRLRVGPDSGALRKNGVFQATIFTPRSGKLKLWAEVGGVKTNVVTVPIVGDPCVRNPKSLYGAEVMRRANPFIRG